MRSQPGKYYLQVFPAGTTDKAWVDAEVDVPVQSVITAAFIGSSPNMAIKAFFEPVLKIPAGKLYLRFANLVPDSSELDLVLSDGTKLFEAVSFGAATNYTAVPPGVYIFYLQQTGTDRSLLYVPNIHLEPDRFYTIYAVGRMKGNPPLQVLIPLDGNSYVSL
jgi:hypothetical protein